MILSVSRRTDIPNYYSEWFFNRINEGFLYGRNPMNPYQISEINLLPEVVDCIVFWTKNPANMIERLDELKNYKFYFQFTLTGYGKDMEPGLPDKREVLIPTFRRLSGAIGSEKVIWRYDPIILTDKYTPAYHRESFAEIAAALRGYTHKVVISFMDFYTKTERNTVGLGIKQMNNAQMSELAKELYGIARENELVVETCAEKIDLQEIGIVHGSCISKELIEQITGCQIKAEKDKNQRKECGCIESVEVGTYHSCSNGCKYCYANFSDERVKETLKMYDVNSPLLCGSVGKDDKITIRKMKSLLERQNTFKW